MTVIKDSLLVEGRGSSTRQGQFLGSFDEMPEASAGCLGCVVLNTGDDSYPKGFLACVTYDDGATFQWEQAFVELVGYVSSDTTINGMALDGEVVLTAEDVGAVSASDRVTKVSQLENDVPYVDQNCSTLSNYYTKQQTAGILSQYCRLIVVDELPEDRPSKGQSGGAIDPSSIYCAPDDEGAYHLHVRIDGAWVRVS